MSFIDNSSNLYADPNAYIQNYKPTCKSDCKPKKVVFSEPYETLPNFYIDNNFKRKNCNCVPQPNKPCNCPPHRPNKKPFCFPKNTNCFPPDEERLCPERDCYERPQNPCKDCDTKPQPYQSGSLPFNLKNILSLLGGLGSNGGLGNLISMLGSGSNNSNSSNTNSLTSILKNLSANGGLGDLLKNNDSSGGGLSNLVSAFTQSGGLGLLSNLFKKKTQTASTLNTPKSSDICIKDYKRVE